MLDIGQFSISFKNDQSGQIVNCQKTFWPVQSYAFDKRAMRILKVNIVEPATYTVEFKRPTTLRLKRTNLFFRSLFQDPIPTDKISIYIH